MSRDSLRPFSEGEREAVLRAIHSLEGKLLAHVGDLTERLDAHDADIAALREAVGAMRWAAIELRDLSRDVRAVLRRDATQEERIAILERKAITEGQQAGTSAGTRWGLTASAVGTIVAAVIQWLMTGGGK